MIYLGKANLEKTTIVVVKLLKNMLNIMKMGRKKLLVQ